MRHLILTAVLALTAATAAAQSAPIVKMDCRGGAAFPLCGANRTIGNDSVGTRWTRAYIAAEDAVELTILPGSTGEGYYGWSFTGLAAPAAGATRVLRVRVKVMSPISWANWGAKFIILGDNEPNPDSNRIISTMEMYQGQPHLNVDKNIDGAYAFTHLTPDQYVSMQIVISPVAGSTSSYSFKFYRNGQLVSTSRVVTLNATGWRDVGIGLYGQFANGAQHVRYRFKDFQLGDAYDPAYDNGTVPPVDPPPVEPPPVDPPPVTPPVVAGYTGAVTYEYLDGRVIAVRVGPRP